jgi:hypothetical protein
MGLVEPALGLLIGKHLRWPMEQRKDVGLVVGGERHRFDLEFAC